MGRGGLKKPNVPILPHPQASWGARGGRERIGPLWRAVLLQALGTLQARRGLVLTMAPFFRPHTQRSRSWLAGQE